MSQTSLDSGSHDSDLAGAFDSAWDDAAEGATDGSQQQEEEDKEVQQQQQMVMDDEVGTFKVSSQAKAHAKAGRHESTVPCCTLKYLIRATLS